MQQTGFHSLGPSSTMIMSTVEQCVFLTRFDDQAKDLSSQVDMRSVDDLPCPPRCETSPPSTECDDRTRRPFACEIPGCNKSFRRRSTLTEHIATHTGTKAFRCPVGTCLRKFTTSGNLSRHKRLQHPWLDAPLECLVKDCGCKFPSEAKLERHMEMVHFGQSSHSCPVKRCGRAFCSAGNLRRHMKQHHEDVLAQETKRRQHYRTPRTKKEARSPTAVDQVKEAREEVQWRPHSLNDSRLLHSVDDELLEVLACLFD